MTVGRFALMEQFRADGVQYMFGNPGTSEQGLLDARSDYPDIEYILVYRSRSRWRWQTGTPRGTRQPAVVQLHSGVGLGNRMGILYQAKRGHSPLIVIAGESGVRYDATEMGSDARADTRPGRHEQLHPGMRVAWMADPDGNIVELDQGYADEPARGPAE